MNGLIASVVVLMMTGMVFGHQPQSSNQNFETPSTGLELRNRFVLPMGEAEIQFLKQSGRLSAFIEVANLQQIDHIVIHTNIQSAEREDLAPINISQTASYDSDRKLEFKLTDSLIDMMKRQGLQYMIPVGERGKYNEVVVTYDRSLSQNDSSSSSRFVRGSGSQFQNVEPRIQQRQIIDYPEPGLYGPRLTDDFESERRRSQIAGNGNLSTFNPRFDSTANRRNTNIQDEYENRLPPESSCQRNQQFV